jgi:hypothetical protein
MRSMHIFMEEKHKQLGWRFSLEQPNYFNNIYTYPLYSVSDIIEEAINQK